MEGNGVSTESDGFLQILDLSKLLKMAVETMCQIGQVVRKIRIIMCGVLYQILEELNGFLQSLQFARKIVVYSQASGQVIEIVRALRVI